MGSAAHIVHEQPFRLCRNPPLSKIGRWLGYNGPQGRLQAWAIHCPPWHCSNLARALAQAIARPGFAISIFARDQARLEALNTNDHRAAAACVFTKKSGHFLVDALNVHILFYMC
jgi:hypothetical protein